VGFSRGVGVVTLTKEEARVLAAVVRYFLAVMTEYKFFTEADKLVLSRLQAQLLLFGTDPVKR
jgi:hypothetical protein